MDRPEPDQMISMETIAGHRIRVSEPHHLVMIDERPLVCSPGHYRLLLRLLSSPGQVVPYACLTRDGESPEDVLARHNLWRSMSYLRAKLWPFGLDIRCLLRQGYLLVSLDETKVHNGRRDVSSS